MPRELTSRTERALGRHVWYWSVGVALGVASFTFGVMWVRQGFRLNHWVFQADEFGAVGQWFSGIAAAAALFSGAQLVVNDRRRQATRARMQAASQVQYIFRPRPNPSWVVHNGSDDSIQLLVANGWPVNRTVLPGGDVWLGEATLLAPVGYRGDQPLGDLVFEGAEYRWTRAESGMTGVKL